ncbi:NPAS4 protein, partial [Polioptila caerulea]|nr:NPAS4 protein [Polioptila caerulea]
AGAGPEARGELVTRLQRKDGLGWTWVYARLRPEGPALLAHNFIISEAEAWCLRQQLAAEAPPGPPEPFGPGLDFPGDLGPSLDLGVGPGLGDLAVSAGCGLRADVGHGLGANAAATVDPGLGATIGHNLGANTAATVDPGLGATIGHSLGA